MTEDGAQSNLAFLGTSNSNLITKSTNERKRWKSKIYFIFFLQFFIYKLIDFKWEQN